ncbi:sensor histidine kinase [Romboutsia weinsteinii]|uniref:histidine kinase n=1 Tax=Romboutsia weinsteinii TaxID=2020949 RepID=A0A371J3K7_9FIRM|nr:HAMP domain-containing sensor histidine kinase [Romboutsia weinsteinii]RDY27325.1 sensor histidine kinase [Romboutsia weinsteinii]
MTPQMIKDKDLREIEKKAMVYIISIVLVISATLAINIFFKKNINDSDFELTLVFIRLFNSVLAVLAFGSCLISYYRVKKDSAFIISLIYLVLAIDILMGQLDYLSFYYKEFTLSNYITVSTSVLRVFLLILAISPKNSLSDLIINNKNKSVLFVVVYTIVCGHIEQKINLSRVDNSSVLFISYNILLIIIYLVCSFKLFKMGIKEKEYLYVVLGSSILMLASKAMYVIYGTSIMSFYVKIISVSITYVSFLIVISGVFIELYIYICKTKILNDNLETFYNLVENNKHSFMYICNQDGEIIYANKKIKEFYLDSEDSDISKIDSIIKETTEALAPVEEIKNSLKESGTWRGIIKSSVDNNTIDCSAQVMKNHSGKSEIAISYMDISDEINMELELEKFKIYDKAKDDYISNLSHELKTPLNIFYSTVQLLDRSSEYDECDFRLMYKKYNKTLHINCKRMTRLINNIMDISRIEIGILKPNIGNYDIVSIVEDVTLSVANHALLKSIYIQFDTNEEEHIVKCDPSMIERVMLNLLSNAIKFSKENQTIYVDVLVKKEWIEISIKDEGIGISKEDKDIIFERFVQVDKSFTRENEGSGIGLSIVKSIIDLHDGFIEVESKIDEGSIFTVYLPNTCLKYADFNSYDINKQNTELELSDIYELSV